MRAFFVVDTAINHAMAGPFGSRKVADRELKKIVRDREDKNGVIPDHIEVQKEEIEAPRATFFQEMRATLNNVQPKDIILIPGFRGNPDKYASVIGIGFAKKNGPHMSPPGSVEAILHDGTVLWDRDCEEEYAILRPV